VPTPDEVALALVTELPTTALSNSKEILIYEKMSLQSNEGAGMEFVVRF
jgi:hypothetical protein